MVGTYPSGARQFWAEACTIPYLVPRIRLTWENASRIVWDEEAAGQRAALLAS